MVERAAKRLAGRPMTSEVNWALLGLVIERPSYGLELFHRFERRYGDVLPVRSESHIYSALNALESRELVEVVQEVVALRQPKPHYKATLHGTRSFDDWLVAQGGAMRRRQEFWVRQLAIFAHSPDAALQLIGRFEDAHLGHITDAEEPRKVGRGARDLRGTLVAELVAEQQRIGDGGILKWLGYARGRFEILAEGQSDGAPGA
jgi:DNA-binding PadR family transcriptional regulator